MLMLIFKFNKLFFDLFKKNIILRFFITNVKKLIIYEIATNYVFNNNQI